MSSSSTKSDVTPFDPTRFPPTLGALDLHLIAQGTHHRLWSVLGAHVRTLAGATGTSFAVWAPNAQAVSVVGDFNAWDGRRCPLRSLGSSGIWEAFVPDVGVGALYKFEIRTREGQLRMKTDPLAREMERSPGTASRVASSTYTWQDEAWLAARAKGDLRREPVCIYEVHLG